MFASPGRTKSKHSTRAGGGGVALAPPQTPVLQALLTPEQFEDLTDRSDNPLIDNIYQLLDKYHDSHESKGIDVHKRFKLLYEIEQKVYAWFDRYPIRASSNTRIRHSNLAPAMAQFMDDLQAEHERLIQLVIAEDIPMWFPGDIYNKPEITSMWNSLRSGSGNLRWSTRNNAGQDQNIVLGFKTWLMSSYAKLMRTEAGRALISRSLQAGRRPIVFHPSDRLKQDHFPQHNAEKAGTVSKNFGFSHEQLYRTMCALPPRPRDASVLAYAENWTAQHEGATAEVYNYHPPTTKRGDEVKSKTKDLEMETVTATPRTDDDKAMAEEKPYDELNEWLDIDKGQKYMWTMGDFSLSPSFLRLAEGLAYQDAQYEPDKTKFGVAPETNYATVPELRQWSSPTWHIAQIKINEIRREHGLAPHMWARHKNLDDYFLKKRVKIRPPRSPLPSFSDSSD
ncbi:hypothetical protein FUAX_37470 [Fulvitalea axinellae]|uniref:Uncharacterized protein n=1 Tax=Fulvitalea axinellae TaxID=1182444 RepID=A0AAU9CPL3_9BACT|nr:hypothetical protein FUAX_37470 [Fulvitalea axinellae]